MIKNVRVPILAFQKALYTLLSAGQTTPIYDYVPLGENVEPPYISLGAVTCKPTGTKDKKIYHLSIQLHCWSEYRGKAEINNILNDLSTVLTSAALDATNDDWRTVDQQVTFYEAFEADGEGYHGVLTFEATLQDMI